MSRSDRNRNLPRLHRKAECSFVVPAGTALGEATLMVLDADGSVPAGTIAVAQVAPVIFGAEISTEGGQASLVLSGTGMRNRSALDVAIAQVYGTTLPAIYAGAQPGNPGYDLVKVPLPANLAVTASLMWLSR